MRRPERAARTICLNCLHFLITHEPGRPYACRAFDFKSARLPTVAVKETSDLACRLFTPGKPRGNRK